MAAQGFTKINPRQRAYLEQIVKGKSKMEAKRIAGYSENSSSVRIETPSLKAAFSKLVRHHIPAHKLAQRIAEGLEAKETKFFQHEGRVMETHDVIAWSERRQYAELAARWGGYAESDASAVNVGVQVVVEHIVGHTDKTPTETK